MKMYKFNKGDGNGGDTIVTDFIKLSQKWAVETEFRIRTIIVNFLYILICIFILIY